MPFNPALFLGSCLFQLYGLITKFHLLNRIEGQWAELIFQPISAHFSWTFHSFQISIVFQLRWCSSSCTKRTRRCWFRRTSTPHRTSQCSPCGHMWLEPCGLSSPAPRDVISKPWVAWADSMFPEAPFPLLSAFLVEEIKQKMSCSPTARQCWQVNSAIRFLMGKQVLPGHQPIIQGQARVAPYCLIWKGKVSYPRPKVNPLFPLILFYKNLPPCTTLWSPFLFVGLDAAWFLNHWVKACKISKFSVEHFLMREMFRVFRSHSKFLFFTEP